MSEEAFPRILFVEDNDVTSASLTKAFSRRQYDVTLAKTKAEGLTAVKENHSFDYLLCDYDLGNENGLEIVLAFSEKFKATPIAIFTGHTEIQRDPEVQEFFSKNNMPRNLKFLFKPIDRNLIFQWLIETKKNRKSNQ